MGNKPRKREGFPIFVNTMAVLANVYFRIFIILGAYYYTMIISPSKVPVASISISNN